MAKLFVSTMFLEDLLFHGRQAVIVGASFDDDKLVLEVKGLDVPNTEVVRCITTKSIDTRFEPVE